MTPDFIILTHSSLPGARLSKPGHWGNRPFDTVEDAEQEARRLDPKGKIARGHIQARRIKRSVAA